MTSSNKIHLTTKVIITPSIQTAWDKLVFKKESQDYVDLLINKIGGNVLPVSYIDEEHTPDYLFITQLPPRSYVEGQTLFMRTIPVPLLIELKDLRGDSMNIFSNVLQEIYHEYKDRYHIPLENGYLKLRNIPAVLDPVIKDRLGEKKLFKKIREANVQIKEYKERNPEYADADGVVLFIIQDKAYDLLMTNWILEVCQRVKLCPHINGFWMINLNLHYVNSESATFTPVSYLSRWPGRPMAQSTREIFDRFLNQWIAHTNAILKTNSKFEDRTTEQYRGVGLLADGDLKTYYTKHVKL